MSTQRTAIADFDHPRIQALIRSRAWLAGDAFARIGAAYAFVKDEIEFGYNASDDLRASEVLREGYGQCNTKGNLLVALMRGLDIPARVHGFMIDKALQRGAIPRGLYALAPARILHSWVEVQYEGSWLPLEGFILDRSYLEALQARFPAARSFCGYGAATPNLQQPEVEWRGRPTYIQREGIVEDFGVFEHPDALYAERGTNLSGLRRWAYQLVLRHLSNRELARIRRGGAQRRR